MFGLSFQMWGMFLNTAKENTICSHSHRLFNNDLDFTIRHVSKNKILYTEPVFLPLLSIMTNIFLRNSVFVPIPVFWELVWLCLSAWISATLWFLSLAAVSQGQVKVTCSLPKQLWGRICTVLSHTDWEKMVCHLKN